MEKELLTIEQNPHIAEAIVLNPINQNVSFESIRRDELHFPRVRSYNSADAVKNMSIIIIKAYNYLGRKAPKPDDVTYLAKQILYELDRDIHGMSLKDITFFEIERAVIGKVLEAPDKVFGVCVALFIYAIEDYIKTHYSSTNAGSWMKHKEGKNEQFHHDDHADIEEIEHNNVFEQIIPSYLKPELVNKIEDSTAHREKIQKQILAVRKAERLGIDITTLNSIDELLDT